MDLRAIQAAYKRATSTIPQLPMEVGSNDLRFGRCRWRHEAVPTGTPTHAHCEHPWSKKRTRSLIEAAVKHALARNFEHATVARAVAEVLDARQDTVLMPSDDDEAWGVRSEREGDGLGGRYDQLATQLFDRQSGSRLTIDLVTELEAQRQARIKDALHPLQ